MENERTSRNQTRHFDNSFEISGVDMFLSVGLWIIFVVAIIGNSLVLLLGIRGRIKSARVPTFLICSLATADLLLAIFVIWTTAVVRVFPKWIFGLVWCKLYLFFRGTMCMASIGTMAVIALERFLKVVCSPKLTLTLPRARILVAYVWIHCIVTSCPWLIWAQVVQTGPITWCRNVNEPVMQKIFSTILRVVNYFIPLILTWVAYIAILIRMWRSKRKMLGCRVDNDVIETTKTTRTHDDQNSHSKGNQGQGRLGVNGMASATATTHLSVSAHQEHSQPDDS